MQNAGHNKQLGISVLVVGFVHVAHMWCVIQLETEDQALNVSLFLDTSWLFLFCFGGGIVDSFEG